MSEDPKNKMRLQPLVWVTARRGGAAPNEFALAGRVRPAPPRCAIFEYLVDERIEYGTDLLKAFFNGEHLAGNGPVPSGPEPDVLPGRVFRPTWARELADMVVQML
ncbi:MAG: hypothetical protein HY812_09195 [Planctomycetes bacterium]|nr:hypothetical protein [Planctomycetota bacterium]